LDRDWLIWLLFSFKGRIGRKVWWLTILAVAAAFYAGIVLIGFAIGPEGDRSGLALVLGLVVSAAVALDVWIGFALAAKRLHDRDRTGWWLGAQILVNFAGVGLMILSQSLNQPLLKNVGALLIVGFTLWLFVEIGFLRGTRGPNRFGGDPLESKRSRAEP
jgi:uncharacterized membrane protein YhaH (DUF805 family)